MQNAYDLYFVRIPNGPVKIGRAKVVSTRMRSLQCGCPWQLELLGIVPGGGYLEGHWQSSFASQQMVGEWFEWSDNLGLAIERTLAGEGVELILRRALNKSITKMQEELAAAA